MKFPWTRRRRRRRRGRGEGGRERWRLSIRRQSFVPRVTFGSFYRNGLPGERGESERQRGGLEKSMEEKRRWPRWIVIRRRFWNVSSRGEVLHTLPRELPPRIVTWLLTGGTRRNFSPFESFAAFIARPSRSSLVKQRYVDRGKAAILPSRSLLRNRTNITFLGIRAV